MVVKTGVQILWSPLQYHTCFESERCVGWGSFLFLSFRILFLFLPFRFVSTFLFFLRPFLSPSSYSVTSSLSPLLSPPLPGSRLPLCKHTSCPHQVCPPGRHDDTHVRILVLVPSPRPVRRVAAQQWGGAAAVEVVLWVHTATGRQRSDRVLCVRRYEPSTG